LLFKILFNTLSLFVPNKNLTGYDSKYKINKTCNSKHQINKVWDL
jgi:hypothetical protein